MTILSILLQVLKKFSLCITENSYTYIYNFFFRYILKVQRFLFLVLFKCVRLGICGVSSIYVCIILKNVFKLICNIIMFFSFGLQAAHGHAEVTSFSRRSPPPKVHGGHLRSRHVPADQRRLPPHRPQHPSGDPPGCSSLGSRRCCAASR